MSAARKAGRKVVLLTGAAGTFGTAFCRKHAARYDIAAVWHRRRPGYATDRQDFVDPLDPQTPLDDAATRPMEIQADLAADGEIARVVDLVLARFGRVDVVVNAAGHKGRGRLVGANTLRNASSAFALNTLVPALVAATVTERYWRDHALDNAAANRSVVNLSAASGLELVPGQEDGVFGSSKAALNMLSGHLADELAMYRVRVNSLAPAPFPQVVKPSRVVAGAVTLIEGEATGRVLAQWQDGDELL